MPATLDLGDNTDLVENDDGEPVLKNTATGVEIRLDTYIDIVGGGFGDVSDRVATSYFSGLDVTGTTEVADLNATGATTVSELSVSEVITSLDWRNSVIAEQNDPPGTPSEGDRYIVDDAPTGAWTGQAQDIAEYRDGAWVFYTPSHGWAAYLQSTDSIFAYDSTDWIDQGGSGGTSDHDSLTGLADDDHTQYLLVDGTRAMSGALDLGTNPLNNATTLDFLNTTESAQSIATATSPVTLDMSTSAWYEPIEATENLTIDITNVPSGATTLLCYFEDGDGDGPYTLDWATNESVTWQEGNALTEVPANGNLEVVLTTDDGGTNWRGRGGGGYA